MLYCVASFVVTYDVHVHVHVHAVYTWLYMWYVDTIDKWDETKLKEVVQQKHGGKVKPRTDIVSTVTQCTISLSYLSAPFPRCLCHPPPPPGVQTLPTGNREGSLRVVLGVSKWRALHLSPRAPSGLCLQEDGGPDQ